MHADARICMLKSIISCNIDFSPGVNSFM
jgi:hypothetical protein